MLLPRSRACRFPILGSALALGILVAAGADAQPAEKPARIGISA